MKKIIRRAWDNWEEITAGWFSFLGWFGVWALLLIGTIYELKYPKSAIPNFIILQIYLVVITFITSLLLILYTFKKCYAISKKIFSPGKSRLLWFFVLFEAAVLCFVMVSVAVVITFTLKTVPGI